MSRSRRTQKEWVIKERPKSPLQKVFTQTVSIPILLALEPKDLLALYLSDKTQFKYFNDLNVLTLLNNKYNLQATSFTDFIKLYNKSLINPKLDYLYQLENEIELPSIDYVNQFVNNEFDVTSKMRAILIDWMFEVQKKRLGFAKDQPEYMGLVVTYIDAFLSKNKINKKELQLVGVVCMHLAEFMIVDDREDISEYIYIVDGAYDRDQFQEKLNEVFNALNGLLIRPTTGLFIDMNNQTKDLVYISYFIPELIKYKPSMIAEAISYIVYGKYKIYDLSELNEICRLIYKYQGRMDKSSLTSIKNACINAQQYMIHQCGESKREFIGSPFKYDQPWHLGEYQKIKKIGEGAYGEVTKIKYASCDKDYVVKTMMDEDNKLSALMEIALIKQLKQENVINICNVELKGESVKIIMPLMSNVMSNMVFNKDKTVKYFKQLVLGLHECHRNDIIHRDIKPENIMYDEPNDQFKLIDFGISVSYASKRYYLDPNMACTISYRAPEAFLEQNYNEKVDIWALGATLYRQFTNKFLCNGSWDPIDSLNEIFSVFGTPNEAELPGISTVKVSKYPRNSKYIEEVFGIYTDLITPCFIYDFNKRPGTTELLHLLDARY